MTDTIAAMVAFHGQFRGEGINHDQEPFIGLMTIQPVVSTKGVSIRFTATGVDGTVYHEEHTVIGPGADGQPSLWTLTSNAPSVLEHRLQDDFTDREGSRRFVFGYGDAMDETVFRETITLELCADGAIGYRYAWGLPGGSFKERSGVFMIRTTVNP